MRTQAITHMLLAGGAAALLVACGDVSDFPTDPSPAVTPAVEVPTLDIPTPAPTATTDPQLAPLWAIVNHDAAVINGDLDPLVQCEVIISDVAACRSALTTLQAHVGPMLRQLQAMQVGDDLRQPYDDMVQAVTALQSGCADDLRYLDTGNHSDNATATHELNQGFSLLDRAQWDLPPDPNATPVPANS